jgi:hypothetical protein
MKVTTLICLFEIMFDNQIQRYKKFADWSILINSYNVLFIFSPKLLS